MTCLQSAADCADKSLCISWHAKQGHVVKGMHMAQSQRSVLLEQPEFLKLACICQEATCRTGRGPLETPKLLEKKLRLKHVPAPSNPHETSSCTSPSMGMAYIVSPLAMSRRASTEALSRRPARGEGGVPSKR